jgi:hypothetical protein
MKLKLSRVLRKFVCVAAAAFCITGFVASTVLVSDRDASAQAAPAQAPATDDSRKAECTSRLARFVEELDPVFDTEHSVFPVQDLFKKYFPLSGCDRDQVFEVCWKSRYFAEAASRQTSFSVAFGNSLSRPDVSLSVQIDFDKNSGNSLPPFVVILSW